jgi:hypothetical protein
MNAGTSHLNQGQSSRDCAAVLPRFGKLMKCVLIISALCFTGNLCAFSQQSNAPSFTFESFLTTNLTIESAVFTKESFYPKSPSDKQGDKLSEKGVYLVRTCGADYLLSVLKNDAKAGTYSRAGVDAGRFNGTTWHDVKNTLILADSKNGQTDPQDEAIRAIVCMIAKLGITAFMGSDSFAYDKNKNLFELNNTNISGGKALVQLNYSNEVVVTATIKTETADGTDINVDYYYETNFYNGRIPVEFSSFLEISGQPVIKLFTIHILQLSVTNGILPTSLIDPTRAFDSKELTVLTSSNGSLFTKAGNRVLTTKEIFDKKPKVAKHIIFIRVTMILIAALSLLILVPAIKKQQTNKKDRK